MSHTTIALVVFVVTVLTSVAFVSKTTDLFGHLGLVDPVKEGHIHTRPVPRGLGVAMFLAFLVGIASTYVLPVERFPIETERILLVIIGSAIVVGVMLVDDAIDLDPLTKLIWQIIASAVVILPVLRSADHGIILQQFNLPWFGTVVLPMALAIVITFFWLVGMMNVMNWVDGLDGLAASMSLVACFILFLHTFFPQDGANPQFTISLLPLALGAAILGFLPFNWHPAKVIMGDAGAMFLGFVLGIISIIGGAKIATAVLVMGLPIIDGLWLTIYRQMHGRSPVERDTAHLHHRLLRAGLSQQQIVLLMSGVSLIFGLASIYLPTRWAKLWAIVVMAGLLLVVLVWLAARPMPPASEAERELNRHQ